MKGQKVFVGIGSGAIQLGLWAYYAKLSEMKVILSDVDSVKVEQIRKNKNSYCINIAYFDRISSVKVSPVEIYNLNIPEERNEILKFITQANDIVTAVPDISIYQRGISDLLREGLFLRKGTLPVAIYVIARMGGSHSDPRLVKRLNLLPITPESKEALLVEDFDRIIVEKEHLSGNYSFNTGFSRFYATSDIGLYEERKLFGHNAVHSLLGFIGKLKGYKFMSEYNGDIDFDYVGVDALLEETGSWFKGKYGKSKEETVTEDGYKSWAAQLCRRIVSPFLYDPIDRIIRDPERKLGWDDRLCGIIRNALSAGVIPRRYALGVAAALYEKNLTGEKAVLKLKTIWGRTNRGEEKVLKLVGEAFEIIKGWKEKNVESLWEYSKKNFREF
jgi:mannitol-1-phosphate 5-dehydrogenase